MINKPNIKTIALQVDSEYHSRIKRRLSENGKTLRSYILDLIDDDLNNAATNSDTGIIQRLDAIIDLLKKNSAQESKK